VPTQTQKKYRRNYKSHPVITRDHTIYDLRIIWGLKSGLQYAVRRSAYKECRPVIWNPHLSRTCTFPFFRQCTSAADNNTNIYTSVLASSGFIRSMQNIVPACSCPIAIYININMHNIIIWATGVSQYCCCGIHSDSHTTNMCTPQTWISWIIWNHPKHRQRSDSRRGRCICMHACVMRPAKNRLIVTTQWLM
jgi:hypothetical protein